MISLKIGSVPQEMIDETVTGVIPYTNSETRTFAELITQEIKEWQDAMGHWIVTFIRDEIWEMVLCPNGMQTIGCMWVDKQESRCGGTKDHYSL